MTAHTSNCLAELVESLRDDLLFAMSRGSKELFHSDTLAWYLERFGFLRETLFAAWQVGGAPATEGRSGVMRELRNLDLVVHHPGSRPLVVENKVFSLPDTSQLNRYAERNLGDLDAPVLVLLSLVDPLWPADEWRSPTGHVWRFRSYHELGTALRPCLPELRRADRFAADTFERWLLLVEKLVALATGVGTPSGSESLVLSAEDTAVLQRARLDATVQKMRCLHTARRIQAELAVGTPPSGVVVQSAMSRGQGIVEMFTALPGPALGWQIQEGQFRLVYLAGKESGHGPGQAERRVREEQARRFGGYFSFDLAREQLGETGPERPLAVNGEPLPFNGFAPDFVYRSIPVPDLTVDQIVRLGVAHARMAVEQTAGW